MCQMRASCYQGDDIFGLKKILQIDLNVKCFELIKRCVLQHWIWISWYFKNITEVSFLRLVEFWFWSWHLKKVLIWKMPWFLYLHLSRHITTVIGRFCGHCLFLVMQKLGQQNWTLEYASIMWKKDIYLDRNILR